MFELNKYLRHHSLPWRWKLKEEKTSIVGSHLQDVFVTGKVLLCPVESPIESIDSQSEEVNCTGNSELDSVGESESVVMTVGVAAEVFINC